MRCDSEDSFPPCAAGGSVETTGSPTDRASTLLPSLSLPAIFREVVGEEEEKEEEGNRLHIFQPLLSGPTSRAQQ